MKAKVNGITITDEITVRAIQQIGGDRMVVAAARVSVDGEAALKPLEEGEGAGLIGYLMKHRHGTPFEHAALTFFVHAPIFVFREWHRHRIGFSYNEESARYKALDPVFWVPRAERPLVPAPDHKSARPKFVRAPEDVHALVVDDLQTAYAFSYLQYDSMLKRGIAKEVARACLPVGIFSSCWVTCNPRSLMAFLSLRTHDDAAKFVSYPQAEIEEAARAVEAVFAAGWPLTYKAFVENGRVAP